MLVVGPNPTFMDYVSHVLPTLGEEAVEQRAVTELLDGIEVGRDEETDVARLKGDPRLREVVARAVEIAVVPAPEELYARIDGIYVRVRQRDVAELLDEALEAGDPLGLARERFRMAVLRRFYERYGELLGPQAFRSFDELERALAARAASSRAGSTASCRCRGPRSSSHGSSPRRRRSRPRPTACSTPTSGSSSCATGRAACPICRWSDQDVPLLDEARALLVGAPRSLRPRDRRRGAGSVADAAARDLAPGGRRLAHDPRRRRAGDRAGRYRRWQELEPYLPDERRWKSRS